ncbi:hypothetical protein MTO96_034817 [Rhipicephalus appendiculatus]
MDKLRRHRGVLRGSTTRLLSEASEILLQDTLPSSADLQERIDGLRDNDTALAELDKQIADALDGEEFDAEIVGALGETVNDFRETVNDFRETDAPDVISLLCVRSGANEEPTVQS